MIEDLAWCGIKFDEGPYYQSERIELYKKYSQQLVEEGKAYYCFCTKMRLELLKREAQKSGEIHKYDNACRHLTQKDIDEKLGKGEIPCIRFKVFQNSNRSTLSFLKSFQLMSHFIFYV